MFLFRFLSSSPMKYTSYEKKPWLFYFSSYFLFSSTPDYLLYFEPVYMYTYVSNNETVLQAEQLLLILPCPTNTYKYNS